MAMSEMATSPSHPLPGSAHAADTTGLAESGRRVFAIEGAALAAVACRLVLQTEGRVVCTGMGKSGHIARKIAATLASTGTPAFYVHPGEAAHGDLGMITSANVVLALSNSGETAELSDLVVF